MKIIKNNMKFLFRNIIGFFVKGLHHLGAWKIRYKNKNVLTSLLNIRGVIKVESSILTNPKNHHNWIVA